MRFLVYLCISDNKKAAEISGFQVTSVGFDQTARVTLPERRQRVQA